MVLNLYPSLRRFLKKEIFMFKNFLKYLISKYPTCCILNIRISQYLFYIICNIQIIKFSCICTSMYPKISLSADIQISKFRLPQYVPIRSLLTYISNFYNLTIWSKYQSSITRLTRGFVIILYSWKLDFITLRIFLIWRQVLQFS